jgi:hypothetical protein
LDATIGVIVFISPATPTYMSCFKFRITIVFSERCSIIHYTTGSANHTKSVYGAYLLFAGVSGGAHDDEMRAVAPIFHREQASAVM